MIGNIRRPRRGILISLETKSPEANVKVQHVLASQVHLAACHEGKTGFHNEHLYSPNQATIETDREQTIYTGTRSTHNNKITEIHANIEHSPERLTRHCEWHQIYDKYATGASYQNPRLHCYE